MKARRVVGKDDLDDQIWSSEGMVQQEAIDKWHDHWSNRNPTPVKVSLRDQESFSAQWIHYGLGQLRLLRLVAPAQRIVNVKRKDAIAGPARRVHLLYLLDGEIKGTMDDIPFVTRPGEFVMLDNVRHYDLTMETRHEVIDLIMPIPWMERHLPDPLSYLGKTISMTKGWAPPLGTMLETLSLRMDRCPLPRPMIAEKIGGLLALATAAHEPPDRAPSGQLARQILQKIETDFANPELNPEEVADQLGISKRYLQSLMAKQGTSFIQELNTTRLDKASEMLVDPRLGGLSIAEIAYRCGILDASYFTRLFRRRFEMSPRAWRDGPPSA